MSTLFVQIARGEFFFVLQGHRYVADTHNVTKQQIRDTDVNGDNYADTSKTGEELPNPFKEPPGGERERAPHWIHPFEQRQQGASESRPNVKVLAPSVVVGVLVLTVAVIAVALVRIISSPIT